MLAFLRVRFDLNQVLSWKQLLEVGRKQEEKELEARSVIMIFPDAQEISLDPREIVRAEGVVLPIAPKFWWSTAILFIIPRECIGKSFSV